MLSLFVLGLCALLSCVGASPAYWPQGTISQPANWTAIAPGQPFNFVYNPRGDYCLSSYNITIWVLTSSPASILSGDATGQFLGRYSYESYPTNPFPKNPVPSQLVMPNFSLSEGGFGAGATAQNQTVYLGVIEEWDSCSPALGNHFSLAYVPLIYNATTN